MKETSVKETHLYDSTCNVLKKAKLWRQEKESSQRSQEREGGMKRWNVRAFFRAVKQPWYCKHGHVTQHLSKTIEAYKEPTQWKRPWCRERLRAGGEGGNRGWDGGMASPTQWAWVWENSGRWWRTEKTGALHFMNGKESDMIKQLNSNKDLWTVQSVEFFRLEYWSR